MHAPLPSGVRGSVAGYQQEMPHLQGGHWDPADPRQLIAPAGSCSFGSSLWFLLPPPAGSGRKLCQTTPFLFPPPPLCISQWACLLRRSWQRDQQSTPTYNTIRNGHSCAVWWPEWTAGCQSWLVASRSERSHMDGWVDTQSFGVRLFTCLPRPDTTNLSVQRGAFRLLLCLYISTLCTPPPTGLWKIL